MLRAGYLAQSTRYRVPRKYLCNRVQRAESREPRAGHEGLTDAEIIEVALAAKKVFIHRRT